MANEVLIGLKIGAAVSGSLHAAFGSARSTVQQLGRATDSLTAKQKLIGAELAASIGRGGAGIEKMRRQYDQVGRSLDQLKLKQERLNTSIARGETLKSKRADLRGQAMETAGTAAVIGAPIVQALRTSIDFQDQLRDIRITAGFDAGEEAELAKMIRGAALDKNQTHGAVNAGVGALVSGNISDVGEIKAYTPIMAEVATAANVGMDSVGKMTVALRNSMGIVAADYKEAANMIIAGGKAGEFEFEDMAKWIPEIGSAYKGLGQTGKAAVAEMTAGLQIARMGAGSSDEAANNYKNFLAKLTSPDTIKAFDDAGIDIEDAMRNMAKKGLSPVKSMLGIVSTYLGDKGPEAAEKYKAALEIKDDVERNMAVESLDRAYKLSGLFRDQQAMSFMRSALANKGKMVSIEADALGAANQDVIGADFALRMDTAGSSVKAFRIGLTELGLALGDGLLPAANDLLKAVIPVVRQFATWASENPVLIKSVVGLVAGLLAGKLAFIGVAYGANLVLSPFVAMTTTITGMSAKWTLLRAAWQAGKFVPLITGLTRVGGGLLTVLKYSGLFLRGVAMAFGAPLMLAGRGVLLLGKVLGGSLLHGLRLAGQAVLWLGRALLMNPIGLLITGIALSAYLIYRYWEPIKGFFSGLWTEIKAGFSGGLTGILGLIINFSPLGLFYRAFAGVMDYFGIELPGKFTEFGGMLVTGLVNGITSMAGSLKDTVVGMGSSIKGWFTGEVEINSPSRVFMGYGANLSEGAAIGITGQQGLVRKAVLGMAAVTAVSLAPLSLATPSVMDGRAGIGADKSAAAPVPLAMPNLTAPGVMGGGADGAGMVVHFSPQITVEGGGDVQGQVQKALQMAYPEFERLMQEFQRRQARRSYGGPN